MHKNKKQLYELIKDLKTQTQFEKQITTMQKNYGDLLDEDTVALLIVDELGRNKKNILKIKDLKPGIECTVYGRVTKIGKSRSFTRKNGSSGKVANLEIMDDTGKCRLVLWNKDVQLVRNKTITIGSNVKLINGYVKDGFNSLELNIGRWGQIDIEPENMPTFTEEKFSDDKIITGSLVDIQPSHAFFRDNGEFGFVTNIKIKTKEDIKQLTLWDKKVKEIQNFKKGDQVEINNFQFRQKNGKKELHVDGKSIIKNL